MVTRCVGKPEKVRTCADAQSSQRHRLSFPASFSLVHFFWRSKRNEHPYKKERVPLLRHPLFYLVTKCSKLFQNICLCRYRIFSCIPPYLAGCTICTEHPLIRGFDVLSSPGCSDIISIIDIFAESVLQPYW